MVYTYHEASPLSFLTSQSLLLIFEFARLFFFFFLRAPPCLANAICALKVLHTWYRSTGVLSVAALPSSSSYHEDSQTLPHRQQCSDSTESIIYIWLPPGFAAAMLGTKQAGVDCFHSMKSSPVRCDAALVFGLLLAPGRATAADVACCLSAPHLQPAFIVDCAQLVLVSCRACSFALFTALYLYYPHRRVKP